MHTVTGRRRNETSDRDAFVKSQPEVVHLHVGHFTFNIGRNIAPTSPGAHCVDGRRGDSSVVGERNDRRSAHVDELNEITAIYIRLVSRW